MSRNQPATESENRRQFGRYSADSEEVEIVVGSWRRKCRIIDESIGGVGILIDEITGLLEGQAVEIVYPEGSSTGYVRSLQPSVAGDGYCLGVGWTGSAKPDHAADATSALVATYVNHSDLRVVCHAEPIENDQLEITLWDGSTFASSAGIVLLTRRGREQDLQGISHRALQMVLVLYRLDLPPTASEAIQRVLEYEFVTFPQQTPKT